MCQTQACKQHPSHCDSRKNPVYSHKQDQTLQAWPNRSFSPFYSPLNYSKLGYEDISLCKLQGASWHIDVTYCKYATSNLTA